MLFLFQFLLFALIFLSFALIIGVPVVLASPDGWSSSKNIVFAGTTGWLFLVFLIGALNSFVV
jgi:photosystem II PsbZ protein